MARELAFKVVNVPADFSALGSEGGYDVRFGHAQNLEADRILFLWRLRHNTVLFEGFSLFLGKSPPVNFGGQKTQEISTTAALARRAILFFPDINRGFPVNFPVIGKNLPLKPGLPSKFIDE